MLAPNVPTVLLVALAIGEEQVIVTLTVRSLNFLSQPYFRDHDGFHLCKDSAILYLLSCVYNMKSWNDNLDSKHLKFWCGRQHLSWIEKRLTDTSKFLYKLTRQLRVNNRTRLVWNSGR
jgi:hypothetical protein